jgi:signal transduction histidine kinase/HAMP domain-containing protein
MALETGSSDAGTAGHAPSGRGPLALKRARLSVRGRMLVSLTVLILCVVALTTLIHLYHAREIVWEGTLREAELVARQIYSQTAHGLSRAPGRDPWETLRRDRELRALLDSSVGHAPWLLYAIIEDTAGIARLHSDMKQEGQRIPPQPNLRVLVGRPGPQRLWDLYRPPQTYEVALPLDVNGVPFATIRLGVALALVRRQLDDSLRYSVLLGVFALVAALAVALALSSVTLEPIRKLAEDMERLRRGEFDIGTAAGPTDEFGRLAYQLQQLGQQMHADRTRTLAERSHFQSAVDQLEDGLMLFGPDGRVLFANRMVEVAVRRPAAEVVGAPLDEALPPLHPLRPLVQQALHEGVSARNATVEVPDGEAPVQLLVSVFPVSDRAQTCDGAIMVLKDLKSVTVSARTFQSLIQYSAQLAALGQVTSEVTHDVKNPLHAMMVHIAFLRERLGEQPPDVRRSLDVLETEIGRADTLVNRFTEVTRPPEISMQPLDLNALVREVTGLLRRQWQVRGVQFQVELDPSLPSVAGEEELLRRAVLNLVLNACQALPDGGTVAISTTRDDETHVTLTVADTGVGIPPEDLERVFAPYYTTKPGGTGIGLPLVRRVVMMHHGEIQILSTIGEGTRAVIRLPVSVAV